MVRLRTQGLVSTLALGIALFHERGASAQALPTGASVSRGTVAVGTPNNGNLTINQTSARAVVNWQVFDVGQGGTVTITQPDKSSALLNRVGGSQGTTIDGSIQSNGQVFLINPNGITISSTGAVNAGGGFVASSLDIADDDFMAGRLNFAGTSASGAVRNAGHITSDNGFVALIGTSVSNSGTITSNLGKVALGAATSATLDLNGDGFLQVLLPTDASDANGAPLVDDSGTIVVNGGRVRLLASVAANAVRQAVNLSGTIQADSVSGVAGDILLQTVGGGDIYGSYKQDGAFYDPTVTPASLSAKGGSVRFDAAGSLQLLGTQVSAASISAVAGQNITIDQTPVEVDFGPAGNIVNPRLNATGSTSIFAGGTTSLTQTELNVGGSDTYQGSRIDISGQSVQIYYVTANAPSGLIRIGGAFRDNAADDGSADFQNFVGRFLQNGATSLPYLPLSNSLYGVQSNTLSAPGGAIVLASVMPYIGQSTISIAPASALDPVSLAIDFRNSDGVGNLSGVLGSLSGRTDLDHLWIGAPTINIGDYTTRPYASTLYLNRSELSGLYASTLTIEGADGLTVSAPVSFADPQLSYRLQYYDGNGALHVAASGGPEASQLPQVGSVNAGTAALSYANNGLIVTQTSDRAVIDWQSFNLASGFSATFNLPTATSAILNRVSASAGVSTIAGTLSSNGQVFLVNPNGVVIGSGGAVSAMGGFTASSLSLTNDAFMAGTLAWGANPSAGGISNAGSITASNATVALLGGTITNTGTIATGTAGTVSLIASGTGTVNVGQVSGGTLQLGAQDVTIGTTPGADGLSLTPTAALGLFANFGSVSIEAGNDLTIANDLGVSIGTLSSLSFSAGRSLTVNGQLQTAGTALSLTADSGTAALGLSGARGSGAATLDLSGGTLGSSNSVALTLAGASGIAGEVIKLAPTNVAGNLSISAATGDAIRFGGNVSAGGTIALTGSLQFAADTIVSAPNLSWDAAAGDTVSGFGNGAANFTAAAALVSNGTTLFRGTLQDGAAARIALDGFAPGNTSITYGDDAHGLAATMALRLVSGSLQPGDTLASLLGAGEIGISGAGAGRRNVGTYTVSLTAPTGTSSAADKAGYFFDLRLPATNSFTVTAKPITYSIADAQSTYGTAPTSSANLTGILSGDSVTGIVSVVQGATSSVLGAPLNAGSYTLKVTGLSGASAGNYVVATSGDTTGTLSVTPLTISATALNATSVYGTAAVLGTAQLSGVLSGDQVSGTETLRIGGVPTAPTDRLKAGSYAITVAGLAGAAAANYTLGPVTDALLTISPKTVQLSLASSGYTYGSPNLGRCPDGCADRRLRGSFGHGR